MIMNIPDSIFVIIPAVQLILWKLPSWQFCETDYTEFETDNYFCFDSFIFVEFYMFWNILWILPSTHFLLSLLSSPLPLWNIVYTDFKQLLNSFSGFGVGFFFLARTTKLCVSFGFT